MSDALFEIADQFLCQGRSTHIQNFGSGNINDTFLVTTDAPQANYFVLQRINAKVFLQPQLVMQNMRQVCEHIQSRLQTQPLDRRWEMPRVLITPDGKDCVIAADGSFWRAISFIANARSFDTITDSQQAREIGYALATFHHLICDLPSDRLADTLPSFHITPLYLQAFDRVSSRASVSSSAEVNYCRQFIDERVSFASVLEDAKAAGKLPLRLMHGDPKINNILFDMIDRQAVSIIDLDTVKPGTIHYDLGDCLRSAANLAGEETRDWQNVCFDTELCANILQGYLGVARSFLTDNDYLYLFDSIRLIAFELGLRFFTDYLAGNVYFKTEYPEHNLARALVQFQLTASIEAQEPTIRQIITSYRYSP
jgi:Ser/Thr protein kinase RdoA (MazF antagonist)